MHYRQSDGSILSFVFSLCQVDQKTNKKQQQKADEDNCQVQYVLDFQYNDGDSNHVQNTFPRATEPPVLGVLTILGAS